MSRYRQSFNEAYQQVEKWSKDVEVKSTGEHKDKTIGQLEKEVDALRGKSNNEKEMGGLLFAIRAKQGWKKGEGSTGVGESTQIKHEKGEQKPEKAERGERKAGESDDDYEDRESGGPKGFRPDPFKKKKKQDDLDRDDEAQATRSKIRPTAEDHNCDEVHPDVSHKDWISQKDEALDTWHPDPAKDRKSTSMKHTAKAVAHHDAQKKKPTMDTRQAAAKIQDILKKQRERKAAQKESNLPPHLSKFLDKKGNPNKEAQARIDAGKKKRAVATKVKDVTPKGYGPSEEVEFAIMSLDHKEAPRKLKITQKGLDALRTARDKPKEKSTKLRLTKKGREAIKDEVEIDELSPELVRRAQAGALRKKTKADERHSSSSPQVQKPHKQAQKFGAYAAKKEDVKIDELSNELLGKYKKKSAAASSAAAKAGDHDKSHKRYKGINRATTLQFRNDAKKEDMSLAPKGKGRKAAKAMYGVKEDLEFRVTIKGIPPFYVPAKTAAAVKQSLRKQLKHPDDIESIIRVTKAAQKIDYRKRAQGKTDEDDNKK